MSVTAGWVDQLQEQVLGGSMLVALPVAGLAGLVSFASPCVLPLVPGYLGYVTGLTGVDLGDQRRGRVLAGAVLFVLGFSAVFLLMGFTAGAVGATLYRWQDEIARVLGVVVILMGLVFVGALDRFVPWLSSDRRPDWRPTAGLAGAPLLGVVFGLGWAPCIGPVFSAVALLGVNEGTAGRGGALAAAYCLGLGLPFLLVAAGFGRGMRVLDVLRRHRAALTRAGGVLLVVVGVLLVTGAWNRWLDALRVPISGFEPVI